MKILQPALIFGLLTSTSTVFAQGQNFGALTESQQNLVQIESGAENAFVASLGYGRIIRIAQRPLVLSTKFTLPWASPDLNDFRLSVGGAMPITTTKNWKLIGSTDFVVRGVGRDLSRSTNLGVRFAAFGGYYAESWFVAGELGLDWALSTYVKHRQKYLDTVYEDAKSGWYANTGANFNYGLVSGFSFSRYDVVLRLGQGRDIQGSPNPLPFYATLGLNTRF